jgi:hypothetical protein
MMMIKQGGMPLDGGKAYLEPARQRLKRSSTSYKEPKCLAQSAV